MLSKISTSTLISTTFICLIIQLIDMLSYGNALFYSNSNALIAKLLKPEDIIFLKNCGSLCYIYSTIISQLAFNYFSKIPSAILSGVIVESLRSMSNSYGYVITKYVDTLDGYISNFFVMLIISTLSFSLTSLLLAYFNFGHFMKFIPKAVINGCFGTIGLIQFPVGWECLVPNGFSREKLGLISVGILVGIVLFVLQSRWPSTDFLIPLYFLVLVILSYLFFFSNIFSAPDRKRFDLIRELNLLPEKESILHLPYIFKHFDYKTIKWQCIIYNIPNIFSIVFFNIIYSTVNLPAYQYSTGLNVDYTYELAAQGLSNIFTMIPSYFVASYSITFHRIGGTHKIYGYVSAFAMIFTAIFGLVLKGFVPTFLLSMVPFLLCFTFLHTAFFATLKEASIIEYFVSIFVCFIAFYTKEFSQGILAGVLLYLSSFSYVFFRLERRKLKDSKAYMNSPVNPVFIPLNALSNDNFDKNSEYYERHLSSNETDKERSGPLRLFINEKPADFKKTMYIAENTYSNSGQTLTEEIDTFKPVKNDSVNYISNEENLQMRNQPVNNYQMLENQSIAANFTDDTNDNTQNSAIVRTDVLNYPYSFISISYSLCFLTLNRTAHLHSIDIVDLRSCKIIDWHGTDELVRLKPRVVIGRPFNFRTNRIEKVVDTLEEAFHYLNEAKNRNDSVNPLSDGSNSKSVYFESSAQEFSDASEFNTTIEEIQSFGSEQVLSENLR